MVSFQKALPTPLQVSSQPQMFIFLFIFMCAFAFFPLFYFALEELPFVCLVSSNWMFHFYVWVCVCAHTDTLLLSQLDRCAVQWLKVCVLRSRFVLSFIYCSGVINKNRVESIDEHTRIFTQSTCKHEHTFMHTYSWLIYLRSGILTIVIYREMWLVWLQAGRLDTLTAK